jgi:hypothetical protein
MGTVPRLDRVERGRERPAVTLTAPAGSVASVASAGSVASVASAGSIAPAGSVAPVTSAGSGAAGSVGVARMPASGLFGPTVPVIFRSVPYLDRDSLASAAVIVTPRVQPNPPPGGAAVCNGLPGFADHGDTPAHRLAYSYIHSNQDS